jgi:hypothetical protein
MLITKKKSVMEVKKNLLNVIESHDNIVRATPAKIETSVSEVSEKLVTTRGNFFNEVSKIQDENIAIPINLINTSSEKLTLSNTVVLNQNYQTKFHSASLQLTQAQIQEKNAYLEVLQSKKDITNWGFLEMIKLHTSSFINSIVNDCSNFVSKSYVYPISDMEFCFLRSIISSVNRIILSPMLDFLIHHEYSSDSCLIVAIMLSPIFMSLGTPIFKFYWDSKKNVGILFKKLFAALNFPGSTKLCSIETLEEVTNKLIKLHDERTFYNYLLGTVGVALVTLTAGGAIYCYKYSIKLDDIYTHIAPYIEPYIEPYLRQLIAAYFQRVNIKANTPGRNQTHRDSVIHSTESQFDFSDLKDIS